MALERLMLDAVKSQNNNNNNNPNDSNDQTFSNHVEIVSSIRSVAETLLQFATDVHDEQSLNQQNCHVVQSVMRLLSIWVTEDSEFQVSDVEWSKLIHLIATLSKSEHNTSTLRQWVPALLSATENDAVNEKILSSDLIPEFSKLIAHLCRECDLVSHRHRHELECLEIASSVLMNVCHTLILFPEQRSLSNRRALLGIQQCSSDLKAACDRLGSGGQKFQNQNWMAVGTAHAALTNLVVVTSMYCDAQPLQTSVNNAGTQNTTSDAAFARQVAHTVAQLLDWFLLIVPASTGDDDDEVANLQCLVCGALAKLIEGRGINEDDAIAVLQAVTKALKTNKALRHSRPVCVAFDHVLAALAEHSRNCHEVLTTASMKSSIDRFGFRKLANTLAASTSAS